ncbi:TPA: hypothetical protein RG395_001004 [Legionella pneumophila]|nr:hypothetical protein [Legionella pneumophila]HAT5916124.1 hypothetical protein [Legionella pneumophila]HAT7773718.1 hypothetical protein [Legionella pneumophila]HAT7825293.1 hypothetical protein [Legionella pneumophila]HAT7918630.1 hypothetical protein [Legionella pneumophila]
MSKTNPVNRTIAELKLEGIAVSAELHRDMELHSSGQISEQEFLTRAIKRATDNERSLSVSRNEHAEKSL